MAVHGARFIDSVPTHIVLMEGLMKAFSTILALTAFVGVSAMSGFALADEDKKEEKKGGHVVVQMSDDKKEEQKDKGGHVVFSDDKKDETKDQSGK
jgi:hypothetical protein